MNRVYTFIHSLLRSFFVLAGPKKCAATDFRCNNGQCVPAKWKCDGDGDCIDKSDEFSCNITTKAPATCSSEFWRCDNGHCILRSWKCDGDTDCTDGSDEKNCGKSAVFLFATWVGTVPGGSCSPLPLLNRNPFSLGNCFLIDQ